MKYFFLFQMFRVTSKMVLDVLLKIGLEPWLSIPFPFFTSEIILSFLYSLAFYICVFLMCISVQSANNVVIVMRLLVIDIAVCLILSFSAGAFFNGAWHSNMFYCCGIYVCPGFWMRITISKCLENMTCLTFFVMNMD